MIDHRPRAMLHAVDGDNSDTSESSGELHEGIGVLVRATAASKGPRSKLTGAAGINASITSPQRRTSDSDGSDAFWESEDDDDGLRTSLPGVHLRE